MADDDKKESGLDAGRTVLGGLAGLVLGMLAPPLAIPLGIAGKVVASTAYALCSRLVNKKTTWETSVGEGAAAYGGMALGQYLNPLYYIL